ncbi:hypothetical protein F5884DRAFT_323965 [Xylogone sp. PMI_703]|nr:hypothetical protein F5884DRAFT_323965 [Xylogone sp. PMI_703]
MIRHLTFMASLLLFLHPCLQLHLGVYTVNTELSSNHIIKRKADCVIGYRPLPRFDQRRLESISIILEAKRDSGPKTSGVPRQLVHGRCSAAPTLTSMPDKLEYFPNFNAVSNPIAMLQTSLPFETSRTLYTK